MSPRKRIKVWVAVLLGLPALCLLLVLVSFVSNLSLPAASSVTDRLSEQDKAQLAEFNRLRAALGDSVWPGFGGADIPAILYNEERAFLVGVADPPDGWVKVPETSLRGAAWQPVSGDDFGGAPYYSQPVTDAGNQIGAFTVRVGDRYAACMNTLEWMRIGLTREVRGDLPPFLQAVFPYRVFPLALFNAETHVMALEHEAFHAYQATRAPQRLIDAELAERNVGNLYRQQAGRMEEAWQVEFALLQDAMGERSDAELRDLANRFLAQRAQRREQAGLSAELAQYEREREWLEGLAKYAELSIWRAGGLSESYQPLPVARGLASVNEYRGFQRYWNEQIRLLGQQHTSEGDGRFYYSGWVQAEILDRLSPGWKERAFEEGVFLEDLLAQALN